MNTRTLIVCLLVSGCGGPEFTLGVDSSAQDADGGSLPHGDAGPMLEQDGGAAGTHAGTGGRPASGGAGGFPGTHAGGSGGSVVGAGGGAADAGDFCNAGGCVCDGVVCATCTDIRTTGPWCCVHNPTVDHTWCGCPIYGVCQNRPPGT